MDILDNQNVIASRDKSDALGLLADTTHQLSHNYGVEDVQIDHPIRNVVFTGMGGSALQAEFLRTWPTLKVPFVVSKDYNLPAFVDGSTLVIASSYSGNTEETLTALAQAREKGARIAVTTGGGKLQQIAQEHGDLLVLIPKAVQPRMAVFYAYRALLEIVVAHGLADRGALGELDKVAAHLQSEVQTWLKEVPADQNLAKQLAVKAAGKTPIIYAGPLMAPAAYKWKIGFNESSKNTAWMGVLPEFNHNEFMGWTSHPAEKPFFVIDLVSSFEHERTQKRFEISDRLLSGMRPKAHRLEARGSSVEEHMFYLVLLGDFVGVYLGILNGVDPSPVELVEKFKKELG